MCRVYLLASPWLLCWPYAPLGPQPRRQPITGIQRATLRPAAAEHGTTQPRIGPLLHLAAPTTTYPSSGTTNQAEFYGSSGTVGVYSTQNLQALLFDAGTSFTLTSTGSPLSVLNFNNTASTIGLAGSGVINVPISTIASTTLTITGVSSGKLTLGGASTFRASSNVVVTGSPTVVVTNAAAFGSGTTTWNIAPDKGNSTLDLQSGSLPAGQVLITSLTSGSSTTVYQQLGNFTIVSDPRALPAQALPTRGERWYPCRCEQYVCRQFRQCWPDDDGKRGPMSPAAPPASLSQAFRWMSSRTASPGFLLSLPRSLLTSSTRSAAVSLCFQLAV